jgi:hypothetical protein
MFEGTDIDAAALTQGISAWTMLLGAVTSEVFSQLGPLPDGAALFECLLAGAGAFLIEPEGPHSSTGSSTPVCTA